MSSIIDCFEFRLGMLIADCVPAVIVLVILSIIIIALYIWGDR